MFVRVKVDSVVRFLKARLEEAFYLIKLSGPPQRGSNESGFPIWEVEYPDGTA